MAAGARELVAQERLGDNVGLGGHRGLIQTGHAETAWGTLVEAALHFDQLDDEPVERMTVEEGLM